MANIVQQPQGYYFAGNLSDLVVTSDRAVTFAIDGLLEERYEPDASGRVVIPLRAFFEAHLHAPGLDEIPAEGLPLTAYTYSIDGTEAGTFCVLPGGVASRALDTEIFLYSNFLTWQPQTPAAPDTTLRNGCGMSRWSIVPCGSKATSPREIPRPLSSKS